MKAQRGNPALDGGGPEVVTISLLGAFGKRAFYSCVNPHSLTQLPIDGFTYNLLLDLFIIWRQIHISFKKDENIGHIERRSKNVCIIGGTLNPQRNTSLRTSWFNTFLEINGATPDLTLWRLNWSETVQKIKITYTWWWPKWGRNK